jgi:signal transduction histidine kinase
LPIILGSHFTHSQEKPSRRFDKQALHDIQLTVEAKGIWEIFHAIHPNLMDKNNQDLRLPSLTYFKYLDVGITIHHSDTVSIGCSFRPIALDVPDLFQLVEALTRVEVHLTNATQVMIRFSAYNEGVQLRIK